MTTTEAFAKFIAENPHLVSEEVDLMALRAAFLAGASHGIDMSHEMVLGKLGNLGKPVDLNALKGLRA